MGYWSYVLTVLSLTGMWIAGRKSRWGWAFGLAIQPVWAVYAVVTRQWGFIASCVGFGFVYARNFVLWGRQAA